MALNIYKNGDMPLVETTNKVTTPSLCYYKDGTKYVPLITKTGTVTIGNYIYSYVSNKPTLHTIYNNTEYVVPNDSKNVNIDIPAGIYSPSTFEDLIANYISQNGSRTVKNSFSVIVNGQTYNVPAGRAICYTSQYAGTARFVTFSGKQKTSEDFEAKPFSSQGVYCVYWNVSSSGQGDTYYKFNIQVTEPIKFN